MKNNPRWFLPLSLFLCFLVCVHISLSRAQTNSEPWLAQCEDIPKQKANAPIAVVILVIGAIFFYGIYKCAKVLDKKPAPEPPPPKPPPPPPGYGTNCNPNHPEWPCTNLYPVPKKAVAPSNYSRDYLGVKDSMAGHPWSSSNAFITLYDWSENLMALDDDGALYDMWFEGTLPVLVTSDFIEWRRTLTVTGWVSPTGIKAVYYDEGVPLCTNFSRTIDPSSPGYNQLTNIDLVEINPVRPNVPQRFFLTIPTE